MASNVCPRCSADIDWAVDIREDYDRTDGLCEGWGRRHAVLFSADCTNYNYGIGGWYILGFRYHDPQLSFLLDHGINPISPDTADRHEMNRVHEDYSEDVLDIDPLTARFTTTVDGDEFSMTIDKEWNVIDVSY